MPEPTTYREPARPGAAMLDAPPPAEGGHRVVALASMAGLASAGALVTGQLELVLLLGAGAAAAAAHLWRAASSERRGRDLCAFLQGDAVIEGPGTWTSPDGHRRVRAVPGDAAVRWEALDPCTGETLTSHRAPAGSAPLAVEMDAFERRVAYVCGRARRARCFDGLPEELGLGGAPAIVEPALLVLLIRRDGVLVERRDAHGELLGDTLHSDEDAALRALDLEYGDGMGPFRETPLGLPQRSSSARPSWDEGRESRLAL